MALSIVLLILGESLDSQSNRSVVRLDGIDPFLSTSRTGLEGDIVLYAKRSNDFISNF